MAVRQGLVGNPSSREPAARPQQQQSKAAPERHLVERKSPVLFKFQGAGEAVSGILTKIEKVLINGKMTPQLTILDREEGQPYKVLGTYDLMQKIELADVGHFVQIVYQGEDKSVKKGDNFMKLFSVAFEQKPSVNKLADGTFITDDDVAF